MFNNLYKKSLRLAAHKKSKFFLAIVAFAESSFFPIPPDIMMVPMVIAKKIDYLKIFIIATVASALGGLFGYFIGSTFIDLAMNVVQFYGYEEKVISLKNDLTSGGGVYVFLGALFLAGFTPLPFKVFTITSGIIGFNVLLFFFICLMSRGLRFFVVSYMTYKFSNSFINFMEKNATKWSAVIGLIIVIIGTIIYLIIK
jgi:membrane protein YqaA with SNARE-associated domain